jgi:hypothetical protein
LEFPWQGQLSRTRDHPEMPKPFSNAIAMFNEAAVIDVGRHQIAALQKRNNFNLAIGVAIDGGVFLRSI